MEQLTSGMPALAFDLDEDSGELQATFSPMADLPPLDLSTLKQAVADSGFGEFHLNETALTYFISAALDAEEPFSMVIGERRDGEFQLHLADDLMTARLTLIPPQGGKRVDFAVMDALLEHGVVYGILHEQLEAALAAGHCQDLIIASGDWPEEGSPARLDSLLAEKEAELSKITQDDELARIQYADLVRMLLVDPGDRLMRRTPPVAGRNGMDIRGREILPKPMADIVFNPKLQGATPAEDDPNLLLASIAGQPVLVENGVMVNPVVQVENVDLGTGNIQFDGTVRVSADIKAGMRLNVTGDVIVGGMIEASEINAGGSVSVAGGVIGHSGTQTGVVTLPPATAKIFCKGSVQALFMEHAHIEAADSIAVTGSVRQSTLLAGNAVVVGKQGSRSGQIIGGEIQAGNTVKAIILGSATGVKTQVQVGFDPFLEQQLAVNQQLQQRKKGELEKVQQLLVHFQNNPHKAADGLGEKVEATRRQLQHDITTLAKEQTQLKEKNVPLDQASVQVGRTIHEGVEIRIGKQVWEVKNDVGTATVRLVDEAIVVGR
ncbi:DUF342 domain-containing protein [Paraherbaspirillum soli]|uniref:DUF342 domain-containing protein n=1 Tax=Paraherbaspirillum soli TaxID=631222 RepID=A0ABW0M5T2_9BURK